MINLDSIPKYCINLPQDSLKKEWMRRMFKFVNLKNIQYVKAIDFSQIELPKVDISARVDNEIETSTISFDLSKLKATLGCLFSHAAIFHDAVSNDFDWIMVMEDDVGFDKEFKTNVQILQHIPEDADFISLNKCQIVSDHNNNFDELLYINNINCYIINNKLMKLFLDRLNSIDIWGEDASFMHFISNTIFENNCNAYSSKKNIAHNNCQRKNSKIENYASPVSITTDIKQQLIDAAYEHKFIG